jgi:hypothetical protein
MLVIAIPLAVDTGRRAKALSGYPLNGKYSLKRDYSSYFLQLPLICLVVTESQREKLGKIVAKNGVTLYFLCLPIAMMR